MSPDTRFEAITDVDGKVYRAHERGTYLTITDAGLIYLHTQHVDVILNGVEFPRYDHDGAGDLTLTGNWGPTKIPLARGYDRFEHIEAWRTRVMNYVEPARDHALSMVDRCMASLLTAVSDAETWRRQHGVAMP